MAKSRIYTAFKERRCSAVSIFASLELPRKTFANIKKRVEGKRKNLPFQFAAVFSGVGKGRVGASATLWRVKGEHFHVGIRWFLATSDPPKDLGELDALIEHLASLGEREVNVMVSFRYDVKKFRSLILPISLGDRTPVFDEITQLTGVKKSPKGETIYELGVSLQEKELVHTVHLVQTVSFATSLPIHLIEDAYRISNLALSQEG